MKKGNAGLPGIPAHSDLRNPSAPSLNLWAGFDVHLNSCSNFDTTEFIPNAI